MSKKTFYLLGILFTILIGMWLQHHFCCSENCCEPPSAITEESEVVEIETTNPVKAQVLQGFSFETSSEAFKTQDNFNFLNSNSEIITPVSDSLTLGIEKLKNFLSTSDSSFEIVGNYNPDETNSSIFPDLGLARANAVKNYLVEQGINEKKLNISSQENSSLTTSDTLKNTIAFNWNKNTNNSAENATSNWAAIKNEINANPIRLYFQTGSSQINFTQNQKQQIHKIMEYVNAVEGAKILVLGHTDNVVGVNATNKVHSTRRANFVKDYLIANGINGDMIIAEGKADTQPIADNATEEGRAKNRRVEILIQ